MNLEMGFVIVKDGLGSRVMHIAKRQGIKGGTIFLGMGTVQTPLLKLLDIGEMRKEIVMIECEKDKLRSVLDVVAKELSFKKPHHGIAFTIPVAYLYGTRNNGKSKISYTESEVKNMRDLICTVVDRGLAEEVVDAARSAGSRGGTIIHARGSGIHEKSKLFAMDIEPEKELVLIISEKDATDAIVSAIRRQMKIDKPGNGIIFIQNVTSTYGLF
ncbi:MAG: P-II family nitrogen regulator [Clostridiales bacterium]|nr:P-II family nitrogen regulator [Clostridiales bacterium]